MELLAVLILLYLFPSICALLFSHRKSISILVVNILLGWTVVGCSGDSKVNRIKFVRYP